MKFFLKLDAQWRFKSRIGWPVWLASVKRTSLKKNGNIRNNKLPVEKSCSIVRQNMILQDFLLKTKNQSTCKTMVVPNANNSNENRIKLVVTMISPWLMRWKKSTSKNKWTVWYRRLSTIWYNIKIKIIFEIKFD